MIANRIKHSLPQEFANVRADYDMSRQSRFVRRRTGLAPQGGPADYHYRSEASYYNDIEQVRDMVRNDAIPNQMLDRAVDNIVQCGFTVDPKTGDKKLDAHLKARWCEYADDPEQCDIAGELTFPDMEQHVMRAMLQDGDMAALATVDGCLQLLEAHTIRTSTRIKNTHLGVTLNEFRKRMQFWIMLDGPTPYKGIEIANAKDVRGEDGNRQIFHMYKPNRISLTRGVTAFAPIFSLLGMFEDINFAKVVQQQVVSCFAIFREQSFAPYGDDPPSVNTTYGDSSTEQVDGGGVRKLEGVSPGMEIIGRPGQKLHGFSPNVPNAEYFSHVRLMLQLIGVNLGLPLCLVLMDGSETNFSGWRGAVDEARKGFKANQQNLMRRFHQPVYKWKVRQWLESDPAIKAANQKSKINVFGHKWNAPTWQYIDPIKDAQGDVIRLQNMLTSPRRLHSEGGRDWDEIANESVEDAAIAIVKAKRKAKLINKQFDDGQPVHWRELANLPMPSGVQMTMQDPNQIAAMEGNGDE